MVDYLFYSVLIQGCWNVSFHQLVAFLDANGLLPNLQSADRKHHSMETAMLKVTSDALLAADHGEVTLLHLLDLSAAFDGLYRGILIDRL